MKLRGIFFLLSLVIIANAAEDDKVKTTVTAAATATATAAKTATTTATAAASTVASAAGKTGNDIIKAADDLAGKTAAEILTLKGSFNGTDTTDMGFTYNYKEGGKDWPKLVSKYGVENNCGK